MYNTLVLLSLLPLSAPDVGENIAVPKSTATKSAVVQNADERIPVLRSDAKRVVAAYPPEQPMRVAPQSPVPVAPTTETASAFENLQQNPPDSVRVTGILDVPQRNHVTLSAAERYVLMMLKTEERDAAGNIVTGVDGKPVMVPLTKGMYVFKDQILGNFDDRELQCNLEIGKRKLDVAIAEQEKRIEVEYAAWGYNVAQIKFQKLKETNELFNGAVTQIEVNQAELEFHQAEANLKLQKYTIDEVKTREAAASKEEVERIKVLIELRRLIAPIDGMIVKIHKSEGECLREGDPVLEIMQLNTLEARCAVSAKHYTPDMVDGKKVTVTMPMVNGRTEEFPGKVVFADPKVTAGDWFEVFIEVENRPSGRHWLLQPGRSVTAVIHL